MARAVRAEFAGAAYHVMARGDRLEAIVRDDMDPTTFLRTLAAASVRSGFGVTRSGLMSNHCHLRLRLPKRTFPWDGLAAERVHATGRRAAWALRSSLWRTLQGNFDRAGELLLGAP